jgi:predicted extracellular nuclease
VAERTTALDGRDVLVRDLPSRVLAEGTDVFDDSRKPLVAAFSLEQTTLYIVGVHFTSKLADTPVYGRVQPPDRSGSEQARRHPQAQAVADFVSGLLSLDPDAHLIVAGDVNDFEFSQTAAILEQTGLTNLVSTLPAAQRYTYVFKGYGQMLDHVFASSGLVNGYAPQYSVVHRHTAFPWSDPRRASDHEPVHVRLLIE